MVVARTTIIRLLTLGRGQALIHLRQHVLVSVIVLNVEKYSMSHNCYIQVSPK